MTTEVKDGAAVPETKVPETPDAEGYDAFSIAFDEATAPKLDEKKDEELEAKAPETKEPETKAPETKEPEVKEPEAKAPETKEPEAKAPETKEPETKAPETKEPETKESEPDEPKWYKPEAPEIEAVQKYEKEWPEISAAEAIRTKAAIHNAVTYVFAEMKKAYQPALDRFAEVSAAMEHELTLSALRRAHNDYDTVITEVEKWVETLPTAYKAGAKDVLEQGTPEEVISLVADYKKTKPAAPPVAPKPEAKPISDTAQRAAAKLKTVDSKRTGALSTPDPNDFEAAWSEATGS